MATPEYPLARQMAERAQEILATLQRLQAVLESMQEAERESNGLALSVLNEIVEMGGDPKVIKALSSRTQMLSSQNEVAVMFGRLVLARCTRNALEGKQMVDRTSQSLLALCGEHVDPVLWASDARTVIGEMLELIGNNETLIQQAVSAAEALLDNARDIEAVREEVRRAHPDPQPQRTADREPER